MGLDQYLFATEYVSYHKRIKPYDTNPLIKELAEQFNLADVIDYSGFAGISINFPMGYWRKANHIHDWFVNNLSEYGMNNGEKLYCRREHLIQLKELCLEVMANPTKADELLPTSIGFFYGSIEYDEYYFLQVSKTLDIIKRCLISKFDSFEYQADW